jgi:hypothetical protein
MNKGFLTLVSCFCLVALSAHSPAGQDQKAQDLACEISVSSDVRAVNKFFDARMIVRNISQKPIRVSTLSPGSRHVWEGNYQLIHNPDMWATNRPKPEIFAAKILTLYPGDTFSYPIEIGYEEKFFLERSLTISAGYTIPEDFALQYNTWSGYVKAEPVTVNVIW